jgi:hypothetical protein
VVGLSCCHVDFERRVILSGPNRFSTVDVDLKQGNWVMSTAQLINDELVGRHLRFDLQGQSEPDMNSTLATVDRSYKIKIDESHRILNSPASSNAKAVYAMLIVGVLMATGVPWVIMNISALSFGLPSIGTSPGNHLSSSPNQNFNADSDRMAEAQKGDRLQIHDTVAHNVDRDALAATLQSLNLSSAAITSVGTAPSKHSTGVQRTAARAHELRSPTKALPAPETRPTTIPGWKVREVTNGMALLEGPNGVLRVTPGQTVPGVGRVDSIVRWGNRLIVATNSGLISTP